MSAPAIFGKLQSEFLGDLGTALLQIKQARGLRLVDMAATLGRCDDMVAQYIAGETEMGVVAWLRANEAWPELAERLAETEAERAIRSRQRPLDLAAPKRSRPVMGEADAA